MPKNSLPNRNLHANTNYHIGYSFLSHSYSHQQIHHRCTTLTFCSAFFVSINASPQRVSVHPLFVVINSCLLLAVLSDWTLQWYLHALGRCWKRFRLIGRCVWTWMLQQTPLWCLLTGIWNVCYYYFYCYLHLLRINPFSLRNLWHLLMGILNVCYCYYYFF